MQSFIAHGLPHTMSDHGEPSLGDGITGRPRAQMLDEYAVAQEARIIAIEHTYCILIYLFGRSTTGPITAPRQVTVDDAQACRIRAPGRSLAPARADVPSLTPFGEPDLP